MLLLHFRSNNDHFYVFIWLFYYSIIVNLRAKMAVNSKFTKKFLVQPIAVLPASLTNIIIHSSNRVVHLIIISQSDRHFQKLFADIQLTWLMKHLKWTEYLVVSYIASMPSWSYLPLDNVT